MRPGLIFLVGLLTIPTVVLIVYGVASVIPIRFPRSRIGIALLIVLYAGILIACGLGLRALLFRNFPAHAG